MIFAESFEKRFLEFADRNQLLSAPSVLVAFSGGADSTVLLHLLKRYESQYGYSVTALHVDHGIRGEEALRDAEFCQTFCRRHDIPFVLRKTDIPAIAEERGTGLEETARVERYRILHEYAQDSSIETIATAHNATDNLETLVFHLARGMSIHGAGGIHPRRNGIIRPLLPFSKDEILAYAKGENLPFVYDSTNDDVSFTRNFIRHNLLPALRQINPDVEAAALRFSEDARRSDGFLDSLALQYIDNTETQVLADLDDAILSRVLLIKYRSIANNEIGRNHIDTLVRLIRTQKHKRLSLPGKITAIVTPSEFHLTEKESHLDEDSCQITLTQGEDCIFLNRYRIRFVDSPENATFTLCKAGINGNLFVRTRNSGDTYVAGGMTRKIKKLLCDRKIPLDKRQSLPFLCDSLGVLAVLGLPVADRVNPDKYPHSQDLIYIQIQDK